MEIHSNEFISQVDISSTTRQVSGNNMTSTMP